MKRQATERAKTFSEHKSHKGLVSRIYIKNSKMSGTRQTAQLKNRGKTRTDTSQKEIYK